MKNIIYIFTLNGCVHCSSLKKRFKKESIPFTEIEITVNEDIWNQVVNQTGENVVPTIFIKKENSNDGDVFLPDRDFKDENHLFEIIKEYI
jgi:hypothetical protein